MQDLTQLEFVSLATFVIIVTILFIALGIPYIIQEIKKYIIKRRIKPRRISIKDGFTWGSDYIEVTLLHKTKHGKYLVYIPEDIAHYYTFEWVSDYSLYPKEYKYRLVLLSSSAYIRYITPKITGLRKRIKK